MIRVGGSGGRTPLALMMAVLMVVVPFMSVTGEVLTEFSDGTTSKTGEIVPGGGDFSNASITLPEGAVVRNMSLQVTPDTVSYNESLSMPSQGGFASGEYDHDEMVANTKGIRLRKHDFEVVETFKDITGIDNSSTTGNVLIEEGLNGAALNVNRSSTRFHIGESDHLDSISENIHFDGRPLNKVYINASGNVQWGQIIASVNVWNSSSGLWENEVNSVWIGQNPSEHVILDKDYPDSNYTKAMVSLTPSNPWGNHDMWFNYNITTPVFENRSVIVSKPVDTVTSYGWDPSWNINMCKVMTDERTPAGTSVEMALSPDNGTSWENLSGQRHNFTSPGNILKWKASLNSSDVNVTPILQRLSLYCMREVATEEQAYVSREIEIFEGDIVSASATWEGERPNGTVLKVGLRKGEQGAFHEVSSGQILDLASVSMETKLFFTVKLASDGVQIPLLRNMDLNFTVEVNPMDVGVDIGDDGMVEWWHEGIMGDPETIEGPDSLELVESLNDLSHKEGGDIKIRIVSSSQGLVTLSNLSVEYSLPPVLLEPIGTIEMEEGTAAEDIVDLEEHFGDDYDDGSLDFQVIDTSDPERMDVTINGSMVSIELLEEEWHGTLSFGIRAWDSDGTWTDSGQVTVNVSGVNDPPIITSYPEGESAYLGLTYRTMIKAYDPEGENISTVIDQGPGDAFILDDTTILEWRPLEEGSGHFIVNVSDGELWTTVNFTIPVIKDEARIGPPYFLTTPPTEAKVGEEYVYDVDAEDLEGDELTFSVQDGPEGISISQGTGRVTWTPSEVQLGYHRVVLSVTDGIFDTNQEFTILVINDPSKNGPPIFGSSPSSNAWTGKLYMYEVRATDPDPNTVLFYELIEAPEGMSMDGDGTVNWIPVLEDLGGHIIKVGVSDGVKSVQQSWSLTVHGLSRACVITNPWNGKIVEDRVTIEGLAQAPGNLTRVEVKVGKGDWRVADGLERWSFETSLAGKGEGEVEIRARACDNMTCSAETSVKVEHSGDGDEMGGALSGAWWALILMTVVVVIILIVDLKRPFFRPPRKDRRRPGYGKRRL